MQYLLLLLATALCILFALRYVLLRLIDIAVWIHQRQRRRRDRQRYAEFRQSLRARNPQVHSTAEVQ